MPGRCWACWWAVPTLQLTIPLFSSDFGPWTLDFQLLQRHPFPSPHIVQVRQDAFFDPVLWRKTQLSAQPVGLHQRGHGKRLITDIDLGLWQDLAQVRSQLTRLPAGTTHVENAVLRGLHPVGPG